MLAQEKGMDLNPTFVCAKKAHSKVITQVAFSEKGNQLASCSSDAAVKVRFPFPFSVSSYFPKFSSVRNSLFLMVNDNYPGLGCKEFHNKSSSSQIGWAHSTSLRFSILVFYLYLLIWFNFREMYTQWYFPVIPK